MSTHDDLGMRMKSYYEEIPKTKLVRRMPVIIRIDGKAFHTFTRGMLKPFDPVLMGAMQYTMKDLCENIQGCVLGYTQSDEISLLLIDYKKLTSSAWFDNEVQKMCSISASMATAYFSHNLEAQLGGWLLEHGGQNGFEDYETLMKRKTLFEHALFDARCFNIPKEEVANYFYWRQLDATRNSIESVGQAYFSHNELHKKSCNDIQDMLHEQKGINWNDFSTPEKRGTCCIREEIQDGKAVLRREWVIDKDIPQFKGEDRNYIDRWVDSDLYEK